LGTAPVPAQSPPQPANTQPLAGVAVSVTLVPNPNVALHVSDAALLVIVQLTPAGADVTLPDPVPVTAMLGVMAVNRAVTVWALLSVTVHVPVPEQAPLQPVNVLPALGAAVSLTSVPLGNDGLHVPVALPAATAQLTPLGTDEMPPLPLPEPVTVSATPSSTKFARTSGTDVGRPGGVVGWN
jgi:hypothetical protein